MIAMMASPMAGYVTVRQAMERLNARSPSTVTRLIRDEESNPTAAKPLVGTKIEGHGWFILEKSLDKYLAQNPVDAKKIGFPRGISRKDLAEAAAKVDEKPAAKPAAKPRKRGKG
jgi:hypothetical protein